MKDINKILCSLIVLSSFSVNVNAEELKGNKTNLHVPKYGEKAKSEVAVGNLAPNFSAVDSNGNKFNLANYKGKNSVLLVFYPGDSTPTCTKQLSAIRDDYKDLEKMGLKVFGVNPAETESHNKFIKENKLQFPLLIDKGMKIAKLYNSVGFLGFVNRTVVIINKEGKISLFERGVPDLSPKKVAKLI